MRVTFWGGVGEIGGNIVELEVGEERILLDFGQGFSAGKEFFMDFLPPRKSVGFWIIWSLASCLLCRVSITLIRFP
jgi:mRNA degradation ribonuclease J1/J2